MLTLVLSFLLQATASTFLYDIPAADQAIRRTMDATYNLELAEARRHAQTLQTQFPDHPAGFTLMAETYWWEAQMDPGNETIEDKYYKAQDLAVEKAEQALKLNKYPKIEITAYLASAHGSYARFQVTQKEAYFSALRAGLRAHGYAEEVFEADPNYYDIWVGIGAFNYFTGSLPAVLKPFAFLIGARGDRELGLQQLRTAMEKARYSKTEARIVYYTSLLEDKQYAAAFPTLEGLLADYPDNFAMYVWVTDWHRRQGKNLEGADYFEKLYASQIGRSPKMAQYALFEKAQLQQAHRRPADARATIARLRAIPGADPVLTRRLAAFERTIR